MRNTTNQLARTVNSDLTKGQEVRLAALFKKIERLGRIN